MLKHNKSYDLILRYYTLLRYFKFYTVVFAVSVCIVAITAASIRVRSTVITKNIDLGDRINFVKNTDQKNIEYSLFGEGILKLKSKRPGHSYNYLSIKFINGKRFGDIGTFNQSTGFICNSIEWNEDYQKLSYQDVLINLHKDYKCLNIVKTDHLDYNIKTNIVSMFSQIELDADINQPEKRHVKIITDRLSVDLGLKTLTIPTSSTMVSNNYEELISQDFVAKINDHNNNKIDVVSHNIYLKNAEENLKADKMTLNKIDGRTEVFLNGNVSLTRFADPIVKKHKDMDLWCDTLSYNTQNNSGEVEGNIIALKYNDMHCKDCRPNSVNFKAKARRGRYIKDDDIELYGDVILTQMDKVSNKVARNVYADKMFYNQKTQLARLYDDVKVVDADGKMIETDYVEYNLGSGLGNFDADQQKYTDRPTRRKIKLTM